MFAIARRCFMLRTMWGLLAVLGCWGVTEAACAGEHGDWKWLHSYTRAYRDPANHPGRAVYTGSRYGFYGYVRPGAGEDPIPRSMLKTAPPTMYHWSKSTRPGQAARPVAEYPTASLAPHENSGYGAGDYYAPFDPRGLPSPQQ